MDLKQLGQYFWSFLAITTTTLLTQHKNYSWSDRMSAERLLQTFSEELGFCPPHSCCIYPPTTTTTTTITTTLAVSIIIILFSEMLNFLFKKISWRKILNLQECILLCVKIWKFQNQLTIRQECVEACQGITILITL